MPAKRPPTWPVVVLTTGQSAFAAGVHCPVVLTTTSTHNSIDTVREEHIRLQVGFVGRPLYRYV